VLTAPSDFTEPELRSALADQWAVAVASMAYLPVGWGSHHWEVTDGGGGRWFVTADDLTVKRHVEDEPLDTAFGRLNGSLSSARDLYDRGHPFVVAPTTTRTGEPVARAGARYSVALYPFRVGQSFSWGDFPTGEHRQAILDLLVTVHKEGSRILAPTDDFVVPHRDDLEAALYGNEATPCGPLATAAATLLAGHATRVSQLLHRYDALVLAARAAPARMVLTHGEPHPGNTMLSPDGWLLIDWDTALVAPPERDLWIFDAADSTAIHRYAEATGVTLRPDMFELYRTRWTLADIAIEANRFRRPHAGSPEDAKALALLEANLATLP
jgi:hypothetical protein